MTPRPFTIEIPDEVIEDLDRRLASTRFAPDIDNSDGRFGLSTDYMREFVRAWREDFDWRTHEATLNRLPQYRVDIDGVPIHFAAVEGTGPARIPLVLTHGWPWTFWDFHRIIGPLTDPGAHGGDPADAFDLIIPSLPGFTFSTPLTTPGITHHHIADLWVRLVRDVLGHDRFAAYGGDWGALVTSQLGHKYADHLYGIHLSSAGSTPKGWNVERPWDLLRRAVDAAAPENREKVVAWERRRIGHITPQVVHPQTLAHAMHDSPVGLAAWITERRRAWMDPALDFDEVFPLDFLLTSATLYWATNSYATTARLYAEAPAHPWQPAHSAQPMIQCPTGVSVFADDVAPGASLDRLGDLYNVVNVSRHAVGGHFGPMERPDELVEDIRTTFRSCR
ncbi:epoxide hydrolase family protein [Gordonia terrae]|uniref:epoxide hydrolase family protein n=1 Tax=Gordonia terrae TaxID=2055 RepID=UPI003F6B9612